MAKGAFRLNKENLKRWMDIKEWDQSRLAEELKCDPAQVSRWFSDSSPEHPSWQMLRKICWLTGLDISELITFDRTIEQED